MRPIALLLLLACAACGGGPASGTTDGLITRVDADRLTVRDAGGGLRTFANGDSSVPVEHLREHEREELPVRITWERRGSEWVATGIDDAP